jgi:hypothetical protein
MPSTMARDAEDHDLERPPDRDARLAAHTCIPGVADTTLAPFWKYCAMGPVVGTAATEAPLVKYSVIHRAALPCAAGCVAAALCSA